MGDSIENGVMTMHTGCSGSDVGFSYSGYFAIYVCVDDFKPWTGRDLGAGVILGRGTSQTLQPGSKWGSKEVVKLECVPLPRKTL